MHTQSTRSLSALRHNARSKVVTSVRNGVNRLQRRALLAVVLLLLSALVLNGAVAAHSPGQEDAAPNASTVDFRPFYLTEAVSDIPAGFHTYKIWYTSRCDADPLLLECGCSILQEDNDCLLLEDSDGDGIIDAAPDTDGDGIWDLVDPEWNVWWTGVGSLVESIPVMMQNVVRVYTEDWGFPQPYWAEIANRDVWVFDIEDADGLAHSDGTAIELDTRRMYEYAPSAREAVLHELWHMTQHNYGLYVSHGNWLVEGQARFMQDKVFPELDTFPGTGYMGSVSRFLADPTYNRPLDLNIDSFPEVTFPQGLLGASYDAALWWTYTAQRAGTEFQGQSGAGVDFMKDVFDVYQNTPLTGQGAVELALLSTTGQSFDRTYLDFVAANYAQDYDPSFLDPADVRGLNPVELFNYEDAEEIGGYRTVTRTTISALPAAGTVDPLEISVNVQGAKVSFTATGDMGGYGAKYYEILLPPAASCPVIQWKVTGDTGALLHHSWMLIQDDSNGDGKSEIIDYAEHTGDTFEVSLLNAEPTYDRVVGIVATTREFEGYNWEASCYSPILLIEEPNVENPASVGAPDLPGRFELWLRVIDQNQIPISGLDARRDFRITVGNETAQILSGEYVAEEYWLVVQAPEQPNANIGDTFDVTAELIAFPASDTNTDAIVYDVLPTSKVLIVDRSASMSVNGRLDSAKAAARIKASASNAGDWLGVVSFSNNAMTNYPMTFVPDQDDAANARANAHTAINGIALANQTSVGDGLLEATNLLNNLGSTNPDTLDDKWVMVLLSDGYENEPLSWAAVQNDVLATGADVHTIAFGNDVDEGLMHEIALLTCSKRRIDQCYWPLSDDALPIAAEAAGDLTNPLSDIYVRIDEAARGRQRLWQAENSPTNAVITIEEDGYKDALFSVNFRNAGSPNASISGPATFVQRTDGQNHAVFYAADLPAGTYTVQVGGAGQWVASLSARVTSVGAELRPAFDNTLEDRAIAEPARLRVSLVDDGGPVEGASVTAQVTRPDGTEEQIILVDNGEGADARPNDGVYSFDYDKINELEEHNYTFDITAKGDGFERYKRVTYRPVDTSAPDQNNDDLFDRWQQRFDVVGGNQDPDRDGLTNRQEMLLGTNPTRADTDYGGESDGSEYDNGRDPFSPHDDAIKPLQGLVIENGSNQITINFSQSSDIAGLRIFRRSPADPYSQIYQGPISGGVYTDTGVTNDNSYLYIVQPYGAGIGAPVGPFLGQSKADPKPPDGVFTINNSEPETGSLNVTLNFYPSTNEDGSPDITHLQISNDPYVVAAPWRPFAKEIPWLIEPDPETGWAHVYVNFRDAAGNVSHYTGHDSILYNPDLDPGDGDLVGSDDDVLEVGAWWIIDYPPLGPGGPDTRSALRDAYAVRGALTAGGGSSTTEAADVTAPWTSTFFLGHTDTDISQWQNAAAGGSEQEYVDSGDLAYFAGQGRAVGLGFIDYTDDSIAILSPGDSSGSYGDGDLDWMALSASRVLDSSRTAEWAGTMNGLRLIMGFENTRADLPQGPAFARYLRLGLTLTQAWLRAADRQQPEGTVARVLAEKPEYYNDTQAAHNAQTEVDDTYCVLRHRVGETPTFVELAEVFDLPNAPLPDLGGNIGQGWFQNLANTFGVSPANRIVDPQLGVVFSNDGQLEVDLDTGAYHYTATDDLWRWSAPPAGAHLLSEEEARAIADDFLAQAGLLPANMTFDRVVIDGIGCRTKDAVAETNTVAAYQVLYTRAVSVSTDSGIVAVPIFGPAGGMRVYVKPFATDDMETQDHIAGVVGLYSGPNVVAEAGQSVQPLAYEFVETMALDAELAAQVALNPVALDGVTQREVLSYRLAYWQGPAGYKQEELIPVYALRMRLTLSGGAQVPYLLYVPAAPAYLPPLARILSVQDENGLQSPARVQPGSTLRLEALDAATPLSQTGYDTSLNFILGGGQAADYTYTWYLDEVSDVTKIGEGRVVDATLPNQAAPGGAGEVHTLILEVADVATGENGISRATYQFTLSPYELFMPGAYNK